METTNPSCFRIRENIVSIQLVGVPNNDGGRFSTWTLSSMIATYRVIDLDFHVTTDRYVYPLIHHVHAYSHSGEIEDH